MNKKAHRFVAWFAAAISVTTLPAWASGDSAEVIVEWNQLLQANMPAVPIHSFRETTPCCTSPCSTRPMRSSSGTRPITPVCSRTRPLQRKPPPHRQDTMY